MSQRDKLIARILARPPEADFGDVRRFLKLYGYRFDRQKGSHVVFVKPGAPPITVPLRGGRKVARTYLAQICELLGLDD